MTIKEIIPVKRLEHIKNCLNSPKLWTMYKQCFMNTIDTTVDEEAGEGFIITGDIPAMWLRDSSAQVKHYIPYAKEVPSLQKLIESVIQRQMEYILIDPYANAFNCQPNNKGHKDITKSIPWIWERKYEIDSLCYPMWLSYTYYKETGLTNIFDGQFKEVMECILKVFAVEQNHDESSYSFQRLDCVATDTLPHRGRGNKVTYTGMTWSGFRPSDDACTYGYLIPSNIMAVTVLEQMADIAEEIYESKELAKSCLDLRETIEKGIKEFATYEHPEYGLIYAYEADGMGNYTLMDDANVPSLLSIPYLGYTDKKDKLYKQTRQFILSKENPYYYEGEYGKGIGSPHTPKDHIWPIAMLMQGLTTDSLIEKEQIIDYIIHSDGDTNFIHESFNKDNPHDYTRSWFAWANSLFAEFIEDYVDYKS